MIPLATTSTGSVLVIVGIALFIVACAVVSKLKDDRERRRVDRNERRAELDLGCRRWHRECDEALRYRGAVPR